MQLAHAGRKASRQQPWKGNRVLAPGEDGGFRPIYAPSPIPFRPDDPGPEELDSKGEAREGEGEGRTDKSGSVASASSCLLASSLPERGWSGLHSATQGGRPLARSDISWSHRPGDGGRGRVPRWEMSGAPFAVRVTEPPRRRSEHG